ncbi:helix-turn-helix domain protein [Ruminiclostridium papyrosolvens DSM 2782]|uniref:Helix-turn-helix domain protein n=1 Tax=Ruminiclostridium papyrosolvens DSM 2782 TaxID=588581 RepID=F1TFA4_9FIRM|nr:helix-turn-helix transcriptional regulator [Ruminiclostridium papyrosolvens]EGD47042.1 helix-turn-helix domain protein [Ruminiclostridium papyrosolvens DSM 2782]WES33709.1 helix-turn-helix transcriptional regulator [Ruminiclostridium papyrosolvens DSM 2782]
MQISYNRLWKLMIDKKIKKMQLAKDAKLSTSTLAKLGQEKPVSMDVLMRICKVLDCDIGDIVEMIDDKQE